MEEEIDEDQQMADPEEEDEAREKLNRSLDFE